MKRYLLISTSFHLLILFALSLGALNKSEPQEQQASGQRQALNVDVIEQAEGGGVSQGPGPGLPEQEKKCISDKWYGGIGIQINLMSGEIIEVFKGYSAESSGLQAGDIILNYGQVEIMGEPGTDVMLHIETIKGIRLTKLVRRVKVCIWGQSKEEP